MRNIDFTGLAYLAGGALVIYVAWRAYQAVKAGAPAAAAVAAAINPASPDNLIYKAASAATDSGSLGGTIWGWLNPDPNLTMQAATDAALAARAAPSMQLADELYAISILGSAPQYTTDNFFATGP